MDDPCDEEKKLYEGDGTLSGTPQDITPCLSPDELREPPEKKIPDELREPPETPGEVVEVTLTPGPLDILSREVKLTCDPPSFGDPVRYPEGFLHRELFLSSVLSLSDEVLDYIARSHGERGLSIELNKEEPNPRILVRLSGMTMVEAGELITEAKAIKDDLTAAVLARAEAELTCCRKNREQTATCPDAGMSKDAKFGAVFSATVPAGEVTSCVSQDDADREALAQAEAMLVCFYLNSPFTAKCEERPDRPEDVMDPVPNDEEEIYPGRGLRLGTVEVPYGMFKSTYSQDDADAKAREWGYAQLICWYPNDPVRVECEDADARDMGVNPDESPAHGANLEEKTPGQWVDIPSGFFTSPLSSELATEEAQAFAESLLACFFMNREFRLTCEPEEVRHEDGTSEFIPPAPYPLSPVPEVVIPAGTYYSSVSQEEADDFARQAAEGMLNCYYCSDPVLPTCVPDWVIRDVQLPEAHPDHIDLPLQDGQIFDTTHENLPWASLPLNATRGAPACAVLAHRAQDAQSIAEQLASLTIGQGGDFCTYYNDRVIVGCAVADPYTGKELECGDEGYWGVTDDGEPYFFYSMYPANTCLYADLTTPAPGEYIEIKPGMFMDTGEDKKDALNERAIAYALSLLQCIYTNPNTVATCFRAEETRKCNFYEDRRYCSYTACSKCEFYHPELGEKFCEKDACTDSDDLCDDSWYWGQNEVFLSVDDDSLNTPGLLMDWSNNEDNAIVIPQGSILFQGGCPDVAQGIISRYILELAKSQLICNYGNPKVCSDDCEKDKGYDGPVGGGVNICPIVHENNVPPRQFCLAPKTVVGDSVAEAKVKAEEIVKDAQFCSTDYYVTYDLCMGSGPRPSSTPIQPEPSSSPVSPGGGGGGGGDGGSPSETPLIWKEDCQDLEFKCEFIRGGDWKKPPKYPYNEDANRDMYTLSFEAFDFVVDKIAFGEVKNVLQTEESKPGFDDEWMRIPTIEWCHADARIDRVYTDKWAKVEDGKHFSRGCKVVVELKLQCVCTHTRTDGSVQWGTPLLCGRMMFETPPWPSPSSSAGSSSQGSSSPASSSVTSAYSSSAEPDKRVECYRDCPNYKAANIERATLPVTAGLITEKKNYLQSWETDMLYSFEQVMDELRGLEKRMQELKEKM